MEIYCLRTMSYCRVSVGFNNPRQVIAFHQFVVCNGAPNIPTSVSRYFMIMPIASFKLSATDCMVNGDSFSIIHSFRKALWH